MRAKFGIFKITESGSDELYTARDRRGRPLLVYGKAVQEKKWIEENASERMNLIIRGI
jgi:hypothetical protein